MRKRLQIVLMATTVAATSLSLSLPVCALEGDGLSEKITATDDHGRTIYVNDSIPAQPARHAEAPEAPRRKLMYWSSKDNRWKPVPSATTASMKAARSAAAEVSEYLGRESSQSATAKIVAANFRGPVASPVDIDSAIEEAALR